MSKPTLITSRDPKGLHFIGLCEAAYNGAKLDDECAQQLNERGGEFQDGLKKLIAEFSTTNQFADEETASDYTYPKEYRGPRPIGKQVSVLAKLLDLSPDLTNAYVGKVLPTLALPEGAEGWFAIPSVDALAKKHFPEVSGSAERYCRAVELIHAKIAHARPFYNWREGEINPAHLRVHPRTAHAMDVILETQKGEILIVAAQLGLRHRGHSTRRARKVFARSEFGLGSVAGCSIILTHPKRIVCFDELGMDLPGDEYSSGAGGQFGHAPCLDFYDDGVGFGAGEVSDADGSFGSASGFLPQ